MTLWSEIEDTKLKAWWAEGYSASQIAKQLAAEGHPRRSRNAVIGRLHRANAPKRIDTRIRVGGVRASRARQRPSEPRRYAQHSSAYRASRESRVYGPSTTDEPMAAALNIPLADLTFGQCRAVSNTNTWGKPEYCGIACAESASFCEGHAARFYQPEKPRPVRAPFERRAPAAYNF